MHAEPPDTSTPHGQPPRAGADPAQTREFDDSATLALVRLARDHRRLPPSRGAFPAYKASAEGHVYFFLDRDDGGEPIPMRVDQVVVDLYQDSTGRRHQDIRGLRKRELLPIRDFRYYIDRLTAVQNGFGDLIEIGEGLDVRDVPHPLGSDGESHYRYRTVNSVSFSLQGLAAPIRVREVEVRPRREDRPAFVGSVFLEEATGALASMRFSFTPASYVDPRVDRVTVRLEHQRWEGDLWLPHRQVVEVRRETPEFDLPVGSVIRATLKVTDYEFDPDLPPWRFRGVPVTQVSYGTADSTVFEAGLMDGMAEEGLSPVSLETIEDEARRVVRRQVESGLPRLRLYTDRFSSLLRANRAEGVRVGLGASYSPRPALRVDGRAGFAIGSRTPGATMRGRWTTAAASATTTLELYTGQLRDTGPRPGASGPVNTLSTLFRNLDYTDPHFATGVRLALERRLGELASFEIGGAVEEHSGVVDAWSAGWGPDALSRPLRAPEEGVYARVRGALVRRWGGLGGWSAEGVAAGTVGRWEGRGNASLTVRLEGRAASEDLARHARLSLEAGAAWGRTPPQLLFLLGGRGTLPGHGYRVWGGSRFVLVRGERAFQVAPGWVTGRLLGGVGAVGSTPDPMARGWGVGPSPGARGYLGAGVALFHDLLRLDGAWGVPGGSFEMVLSLDPRLWPYL